MTARPDAWHATPAGDVLAALGSDARQGLAAQEAAQRLAREGPNRLPAPARRSTAARLLAQFDNLLIHVLLGAALVTALLGAWLDTAVIAAVVVINAVIGFIQEGKA
jgi:magnesium-transporting ATPase (P-type)